MKIEQVLPKYESYMKDESHLTGYAEGICFPKTVEELVQAVDLAQKEGMNITVQGARTGLLGGAVPRGGLVINLSELNSILDLQETEEGGFLVAQAGVTLLEAETNCAARNLCFPINPTQQTATLGGVFATGASGMSGVRVGEAYSYVNKLRWVTPTGTLWELTRGQYVFDKNGCPLPDGTFFEAPNELFHSHIVRAKIEQGTDLIDFLWASEGNLGVVAEMEWALLPMQKEIWGVVYFFNENSKAMDFSHWLFEWQKEYGEILFAAEYYNSQALNLLLAHRQYNQQLKMLPEFPVDACAAVYIELRGQNGEYLEEALFEQMEQFAIFGGSDEDTWAENEQVSVARLREIRHILVECINMEMANIEENDAPEGDFSAPPKQSIYCLERYLKGMHKNGINGVLYGHILQNRHHVFLPVDTAEQKAAAETLLQEWAAEALSQNGMIGAEYGIGKKKRDFFCSHLEETQKRALLCIKQTFDPNGLMGEKL